jgi:hypothetical protein
MKYSFKAFKCLKSKVVWKGFRQGFKNYVR